MLTGKRRAHAFFYVEYKITTYYQDILIGIYSARKESCIDKLSRYCKSTQINIIGTLGSARYRSQFISECFNQHNQSTVVHSVL